jgi:predicted TIM-barrel fold metal-dependent hydrolase
VNRRDLGTNPTNPTSVVDVFCAELFERQHFDAAILNLTGGYAAGVHPNADYGAAVARASNDYIAEHWLGRNDRFTSAIMVAPQDPLQAAAEIRRTASDRRFVCVSMTAATSEAMGHRRYWPIYEAASELDLPVTIHPGHEGGVGISRPFANGPAETYFEWHTNLSSVYLVQACSLISRGVLTTFPTLKFVMLEGGVAWLPHLMWRMDKNWKALRVTTPYLTEPPSFYISRQLRLSTQPIEEPPHDRELLHIFDMIDAKQTLLFSSDYPHWDGDDADKGLPKLPDELYRRIMGETALETYPRLKQRVEAAHA